MKTLLFDYIKNYSHKCQNVIDCDFNKASLFKELFMQYSVLLKRLSLQYFWLNSKSQQETASSVKRRKGPKPAVVKHMAIEEPATYS